MKYLFVLLIAASAVVARPQGGYGGYTETRVDSAGVSVQCERREVSPGRFEYSCYNANPGTIVEEKTLWVPTSGSDQELLIRVPNYNFREIIRAALRAGGQSNTNVRISVARPQVESLVEGQFQESERGAPNVQVVYDGIQQRGEVHYGGAGTPYAQLSRAISEPGGRFKKEAGIISKGDQALRNPRY